MKPHYDSSDMTEGFAGSSIKKDPNQAAYVPKTLKDSVTYLEGMDQLAEESGPDAYYIFEDKPNMRVSSPGEKKFGIDQSIQRKASDLLSDLEQFRGAYIKDRDDPVRSKST